ncbi:MAG: hypothetical protein ACRDNS_08485, partial [Trebonia sp.]
MVFDGVRGLPLHPSPAEQNEEAPSDEQSEDRGQREPAAASAIRVIWRCGDRRWLVPGWPLPRGDIVVIPRLVAMRGPDVGRGGFEGRRGQFVLDL